MKKSRKWLKAVIEANRARRGEHRGPSPKTSTALNKFWASPAGRKLKAHFRQIRSQQLKKSWSNPVSRKKRLAAAKKHSQRMQQWWATSGNMRMMRKKRKVQAKKYHWKSARTFKKKWADPKWYSKMLSVRRKQGRDTQNRFSLSVSMEAKWGDPQFRKKVLTTRKKTMYSNPAWRAKISKGVRKALKQGKMRWNKGLTKFTHPTLMAQSIRQQGRTPDYNKYRYWYKGVNGKIRMRSTWEVAFAEWLDRSGIDWQYEKRSFHVGSGAWTGVTYTPDFYLPNQNEYVELKGWMSDENRRKMKKFRTLYPDIRLQVLEGKHLLAAAIIRRNEYKFRKAA